MNVMMLLEMASGAFPDRPRLPTVSEGNLYLL